MLLKRQIMLEISDALLIERLKAKNTRTKTPVLAIIFRAQGEFDFSEGTSAKWIFDVESEKMRGKVLFSR
jgi:hypothetical protein